MKHTSYQVYVSWLQVHENLNFFLKPMVNLFPSTQLLSSFSDSLSRHKVSVPPTSTALQAGQMQSQQLPCPIPLPALTILLNLQGL